MKEGNFSHTRDVTNLYRQNHFFDFYQKKLEMSTELVSYRNVEIDSCGQDNVNLGR